MTFLRPFFTFRSPGDWADASNPDLWAAIETNEFRNATTSIVCFGSLAMDLVTSLNAFPKPFSHGRGADLTYVPWVVSVLCLCCVCAVSVSVLCLCCVCAVSVL